MCVCVRSIYVCVSTICGMRKFVSWGMSRRWCVLSAGKFNWVTNAQPK